jgi:hypothetical protein
LPGNVRQLENFVCQALVRKATDLPLSVSDLPVEILLQLSGSEEEVVAPKPDVDYPDSQILVNSLVRLLEANDWNPARSLESCERHALEAAMAHAGQSIQDRLISQQLKRAGRWSLHPSDFLVKGWPPIKMRLPPRILRARHYEMRHRHSGKIHRTFAMILLPYR